MKENTELKTSAEWQTNCLVEVWDFKGWGLPFEHS